MLSIGALSSLFFFFNDPATTEIYTLSLHDALPISAYTRRAGYDLVGRDGQKLSEYWADGMRTKHGIHVHGFPNAFFDSLDRKSTRLNSSHANISYAVFCLKKKKKKYKRHCACI